MYHSTAGTQLHVHIFAMLYHIVATLYHIVATLYHIVATLWCIVGEMPANFEHFQNKNIKFTFYHVLVVATFRNLANHGRQNVTL